MSIYTLTDVPYIIEWISDGMMKVCRWSTGLIIGYYRVKYTENDWKSKSFLTWKEAEAWYKEGLKW